MDEAILTLQRLADYLHIDQKTVYRMAQAGELPGFKVRRQWRFKRVDIDQWIESRKTPAAAARYSGQARAIDQAHPIAIPQRRSLAKTRGR